MRAGAAATIVVALLACGPRPAPPVAISSVPPPGAAVAAPGPTWRPLAATVARCPDDSGLGDDCLAVTLPARGLLKIEGTTPHTWGCATYDDGVIVATVRTRVVALVMTANASAARVGQGLCHALVVLRGQGIVGPLAAGTWLLMPVVPDRRQPYDLAPLALDRVSFAPAP